MATIFSLFVLVQLLFEGGIYMYFLGKPADSTDGRIRYMRVIQLGLIDAGSSYTSVLLSAVEKSLRT